MQDMKFMRLPLAAISSDLCLKGREGAVLPWPHLSQDLAF